MISSDHSGICIGGVLDGETHTGGQSFGIGRDLENPNDFPFDTYEWTEVVGPDGATHGFYRHEHLSEDEAGKRFLSEHRR